MTKTLRNKHWCEDFSNGDKKLENDEGVEKLFFELASESRLGILRELQKENLKMQEIARRLDVTATEAFRQLQRLSEALLVQKQPEGTFAITQYGKLVLQLSSPLDFVFKYKNYFSTHDVWRLPYQFVNRISELSQTNLILNTMEGINKGVQMFIEAEQYAWGVAEHGRGPELMNQKMDERIRKGVRIKLLIPENFLPTAILGAKAPNCEVRGLSDIPAIIGVTEKEATIGFRLVDGRTDYVVFHGKDTQFLNWVKDVFLYYWEKGKQA
ncbi:MAG: helix-turn-helix domain-containing protein [Candidatus Thermoplasmatota archaeon]|nr:helix-turn-helix domain-containing protein [Candidatus Thermoplasmatota archaeon]